MTMKAMEWATEIEGVTSLDKLVLIGLAAQAGFDSETKETLVTASIEEIARFSCCSVADADEALTRLTRAGLLAWGHRRSSGQEYGLRVGNAPREAAR